MQKIFELIGGKVIECTPERYVMLTPVSEMMTQPHGILHGGMSAFLAEEAGSEFITRNTDIDKVHALGLELTTTHLLPVQVGDTIRTVATPIREGGRIRVVEIQQFRESDGEMFNRSQIMMYLKKMHK